MCVDLTLFPLDTMKTRLQSQQGFYKAGGFRGIYAGVPSAAIGSFPNGKKVRVSVTAILICADEDSEGVKLPFIFSLQVMPEVTSQ